MEVALTQVGSNVVVSFPGPVDLEGDVAGALKRQLSELVGSGRRGIVLDMAHVEFIDSSGLGALISTLKRLRQDDGSLVLAAVGEAVENVLDVTRLNRILDVRPTVEEALRLLALEPTAGATES